MEWVAGNVFIRPNHMAKGQVIHGHAHNFDHVSIVLRGAVHVKAKLSDGRVLEQDFYAPTSDAGMERCHVLIKADIEHEITALEDDTVFWCVYAHRTPQGEIVQEFTGWHKAYQ